MKRFLDHCAAVQQLPGKSKVNFSEILPLLAGHHRAPLTSPEGLSLAAGKAAGSSKAPGRPCSTLAPRLARLLRTSRSCRARQQRRRVPQSEPRRWLRWLAGSSRNVPRRRRVRQRYRPLGLSLIRHDSRDEIFRVRLRGKPLRDWVVSRHPTVGILDLDVDVAELEGWVLSLIPVCFRPIRGKPSSAGMNCAGTLHVVS